jgi:hypothetical protein
VQGQLFASKRPSVCPCRKLKLEHIDGVVRPRSATNARALFGTHLAEPAVDPAHLMRFANSFVR